MWLGIAGLCLFTGWVVRMFGVQCIGFTCTDARCCLL